MTALFIMATKCGQSLLIIQSLPIYPETEFEPDSLQRVPNGIY
ncbi:hypothetical protein AC062_0121 [Pasteurellaceae bacterium NI1060]|nr:hypothetical protein AC062_0121 [Pasteurellaceae bacterium NI1060]